MQGVAARSRAMTAAAIRYFVARSHRNLSKVPAICIPTINSAERSLRLDDVRPARATLKLEGGGVNTEE
jgi:hypothetical protein